MKARAVGFIAIKEGKGEKLETRPELDNAQFLFTYYEDNEFRKTLEDTGYIVLKNGYMPMSERTSWLTYHVEVR